MNVRSLSVVPLLAWLKRGRRSFVCPPLLGPGRFSDPHSAARAVAMALSRLGGAPSRDA